jgi:glutamate/tyrosine decarboxylase-like PLP-dependent enzyme
VWKKLEEELSALRYQDLHWSKGLFYFFWRRSGQAAQLAAKEAANMFFNQLFIGELRQPSGLKLAGEIERIVKELLAAPPEAKCTLTQGGTESNIFALLAARDRTRAMRRLKGTPNVVVPNTAHPSFDKGAHYLGVEVIRVPEGADHRADVGTLAAAIDDNTIMLAVSAPNYPYGVIDPVRQVAELALSRELWLHVDGCCSFLLPFMRRAGADIPAYDFTVGGVESISVDLHKFAYAPPGISTLTLRDVENHKYHVFEHSTWPAGTYKTETFAGSRAMDVIAATWTVMQTLGEQGYLEIAQGILETAQRLRDGIAEIPGLEVAVPPETMFFLITSHIFDIAAVAEGMTERGYPTAWYELDHPAIHFILDPIDDHKAFDAYLRTLDDVCEEVRTGQRRRSAAKAVYA